MVTQPAIRSQTGTTPWRIIGWGLAGVLILTPAIAMQFTSEVNWTFSDFVVVTVMLLFFGSAIEFIVCTIRSGSARALATLVVIGGFLWLWAELAVGVFTNWGS